MVAVDGNAEIACTASIPRISWLLADWIHAASSMSYALWVTKHTVDVQFAQRYIVIGV